MVNYNDRPTKEDYSHILKQVTKSREAAIKFLKQCGCTFDKNGNVIVTPI